MKNLFLLDAILGQPVQYFCKGSVYPTPCICTNHGIVNKVRVLSFMQREVTMV